MGRRRHVPEQIVRKLREADRVLTEGPELAEVGPAPSGLRGHVPPVVGPVRRDEGRGHQAVEGARAGGRPAGAGRR